ncbi:hypothetical protein RB195_023091 [Necator americanus]|uniref:Uncharacterized protein n=1 Tax=Necator americanus TaxID=51031 RepID=A0ABR1EIG2_NECAM
MKIFSYAQIIPLLALCNKPPVVSKKSKLCGNELCDEVLFKTRVKRAMSSNHEAFLPLVEGDVVDVTAVKFSDRTDLMEGMLVDGRKGNVYVGAIDLGPYVEFLRSAIEMRKELKEMSQDRVDFGSRKVLGTIRADLHLVRDYNVQARQYAQEQNIPKPEFLPLPADANINIGHMYKDVGSHSRVHGHGTGNVLDDISYEDSQNSRFHRSNDEADMQGSAYTKRILDDSPRQYSTEEFSSVLANNDLNNVLPNGRSADIVGYESATDLHGPNQSNADDISPQDSSVVIVARSEESRIEHMARVKPSQRSTPIPPTVSTFAETAEEKMDTDSGANVPVSNKFHEGDLPPLDITQKIPLDIVARNLEKEETSLPFTYGMVSPPSTRTASQLHPDIVSEGSEVSSHEAFENCGQEECRRGQESLSSGAKTPVSLEEQLEQDVTAKPVHTRSIAKSEYSKESTIELAPDYSDAVDNFLVSIADGVRAVPFLALADTTGMSFILHFAFMLVAVVAHFIPYFVSNASDSTVFDGMVAHDLGTKCRLLEEQNKIKEKELSRHEFLETEIQRMQQELQSAETKLAVERNLVLEAEQRSANCERVLKDSELAHSCAVGDLLALRETVIQLEKNLNDERRVKEETAFELAGLRKSVTKLQSELDSVNDEVERLKLLKNSLDLENATLSAMIEEMDKCRREASARDSGGSGGWSDFEDDIPGDADDEKERTPNSSTAKLPVLVASSDVREIAKLRAQLKRYEQEVETTRSALESEKEERHRMESELRSFKKELEKKAKEVEDRERERARADERCNELLAIMKDNNSKIRDAELVFYLNDFVI